MKWNSRFRCALICVGFVTLFSLFSFRLVYIQVIKHDEYAGLAAEKHVHKQIIYAERGAIFDANNEVLAHNVPMQTLVADATRVNDLTATVDLLSSELNITRGELMEKIRRDRRYIVIQRQMPDAQAKTLREKLRAQNLRGIDFEHDTARVYPNGTMLCHVLGFTDFDHRGIQGIELSMEQYLHGEDGFRFTERNRAGQEI